MITVKRFVYKKKPCTVSVENSNRLMQHVTCFVILLKLPVSITLAQTAKQ